MSFDPFNLLMPMPRLGGFDVIVSPEVPKYELPKEVCPGVPWPPGFREDINRWALGFFGTRNLLPRGTAYVIGNRMAVMRPADVVKISNIAC